MNTRRFFLASALLLLLVFTAGCGSNVTPTNSAASTAATYSTAFTITIPGSSSKSPSSKSTSSNSAPNGIRPNFISENAQSVTITINGGTPFIFNFSPTANGCSQPGGPGTAVTCTISLIAPTGLNESWIFNLFSAPNGAGSVLATASAIVSVTGQPFLGPFTLNAVVSSYTLAWSGGTPNLTAGTAGAATLNLIVKDPSGAVILTPGHYEDSKGNTVTFTLSDDLASHGTPFSNTTLSYAFDKTNVSAPAGTASPSNAFALTYGGLSLPASTITISDSSNLQAPATLGLPAVLGAPLGTATCTTPDTCSNSTGTVANAKNGAISMGFNSIVTISASELGWTGSPYNQTFTESDDCSSGATTIIVANPSANQWTITGGTNGVALCTLTLQDNAALGSSGQTTLQFTVHSAGG